MIPAYSSPTATPTDATLFSDPLNPANKYFLTRYEIATMKLGAGPVRRVSFEPIASGFQLIVCLADTTPPEVSKGTARLDVATSYLISASLQNRVLTWALAAGQAESDGTLKLTLALTDFNSGNLLHAAMTDPAAQAKLIIRRDVVVVMPPVMMMMVMGMDGPPMHMPQQMGPRTITLDTALPFTFSEDLDANVFARLRGTGTGAQPAWNVDRVNWNGRPHTYYQSVNQPDEVYFLPDAFKIGRDTERPRAPALSVSTNGEDIGSVTLTLQYFAEPVWDPQRIQAAAPILQQRFSLSAPPSLAPFGTTNTKLTLNLPSADTTSPPTLTEQKNTVIDLASCIKGSVTLGLAQFRQVYAALFDEVSEILSGVVTVTADADTAAIPFVARANDFAGDLLDIETSIDTRSNTLVSVLRNAIESPIHVEALQGVITKGGTPIASFISTLTPTMPLDLAPAPPNAPMSSQSGLTVTLSPAPEHPTQLPQVLDSTCAPLFDFGKLHVVPDAKAIWRAIMQNQVVGPVSRQITVKLPAATLKPPASGANAPAPGDTVMAVQVVFDNGQTANFDSSQPADSAEFLNQSVKLSVPIKDFVLGESDTNTYHYRIDVVTGAGIRKGTPITDNRDPLYLDTSYIVRG